MKLAVALMLLVLVAGCTTTYEYQQPPVEQKPLQTPAQQQAAQQVTTPAQPLDVKILFVDIPASAKANGKFVVKWRVDASQQKEITHTGVHYGATSVPGNLAANVGATESGYSDVTAISSASTVPNEFGMPIFTKSAGTLYARAHVVVDGKNFWTEERLINVE